MIDSALEGNMSDRHFALPAVVSAILAVLIGLTACGGGAAPTVAPAGPQAEEHTEFGPGMGRNSGVGREGGA